MYQLKESTMNRTRSDWEDVVFTMTTRQVTPLGDLRRRAEYEQKKKAYDEVGWESFR